MANEHALFTAALGLSAPWEVSDTRFDAEAKRIDFDVTFASGSRFACPACGAEGQSVYDTRQRTWQHLHFFEHWALIHADVQQHLPQVAITFDAFYLVQLANEAVDDVRRAEVRTEPELKRTRWVWLKDAGRHTLKQLTELHHLSRTRLKTARAWRIKEALRALLTQPKGREEAEQALKAWYSWARRCRLEPFKRLALTLRAHWQGILNASDSRLSNGAVEGMNAQIQAAKARARGFCTTRNLITVCYLVGGKLTHLPASPYGTTCRLAAA